ncbi:MAG: hypothetical protein WBQ14_09440 [Gaiellaceae bacterium]
MANQPVPALANFLKDWRLVTTIVTGVPLAVSINLFTAGEMLGGLLFLGLTPLTLVTVICLYRRGTRKRPRQVLDWLYVLSLPINVVLIVVLSHWLSVGWTLACFGLFASSFFAGIYSQQQGNDYP